MFEWKPRSKVQPTLVWVERVIVSSGRHIRTAEYREEPGKFYYRGSRSKMSGPFLVDDPRFVLVADF